MLWYLRARNYDPATGRFTTRDSFAGYDGQPITQHRYIYAGNDPVMYTDPSGHFMSAGGGMASASIGMSLRGISSSMGRSGIAVLRSLLTPTATSSGAGHTINAVAAAYIAARTDSKNQEIAGRYSRLASALRDAQGSPHGHHTVPVYMCGAKQQDTVSIPAPVHYALHTSLRYYAAEIDEVYREAFGNLLMPFDYQEARNLQGLRIMATDESGRASIARSLRMFYSAGWFSFSNEFEPKFTLEAAMFVRGKTSLNEGCRQ